MFSFLSQRYPNVAAGIENVFGTLPAYFESQPIASIMYLDRYDTVCMRKNLEPGDIERAINSI